MRPLTETETKTLFDKLANYTGASLKQLIAPREDGDRYVFRLHRDRVYYVLLSIANLATSIARDNLSSLGICLGTFSQDIWAHQVQTAGHLSSPPINKRSTNRYCEQANSPSLASSDCTSQPVSRPATFPSRTLEEPISLALVFHVHHCF